MRIAHGRRQDNMYISPEQTAVSHFRGGRTRRAKRHCDDAGGVWRAVRRYQGDDASFHEARVEQKTPRSVSWRCTLNCSRRGEVTSCEQGT